MGRQTGTANNGRDLEQDIGLHYAGIEEPSRLGAFGVEESAAMLRRFELVHRRLVYLQAGHLPHRSLWELKVALGRHLYEDAEAVAALRERILDLRQNSSVLGRNPDQCLTLALEELLHARTDDELLVGLYEIVKPSLLAAECDYVRTTQPIVDQPAVRLLRTVIADLKEQVAWGQRAVRILIDERGARPEVEEFAEKLRGYLAAAGGVSGKEPEAVPAAGRRWRSMETFVLPMQTVRDGRFGSTVLYRHGAPDVAPGDEMRERLFGMMRVRQEEMNVAELVASVIFLKQDQPWDFTLDLARQEWDEMRHGLFGQAALETDGVDWMEYPQFTADYDLNATNLADAQHAWLYGIESLLMARTGKRAEYEFCRDVAKHPLMTQFQDFDWADEVKHVHVGREWTAESYDGDARKAEAAGEQAMDEFFRVTDQVTLETLGRLPNRDWRKKAAG